MRAHFPGHLPTYRAISLEYGVDRMEIRDRNRRGTHGNTCLRSRYASIHMNDFRSITRDPEDPDRKSIEAAATSDTSKLL